MTDPEVVRVSQQLDRAVAEETARMSLDQLRYTFRDYLVNPENEGEVAATLSSLECDCVCDEILADQVARVKRLKEIGEARLYEMLAGRATGSSALA